MIGTINCVYETPCGWCSKWDKKCDNKIPERGQITKCNPVDDIIDVMDESIKVVTNKVCESESDHEWECIGMSTAGTTYRCKKCGAYKTYPIEHDDKIIVTILN